MPKLVRGKPLWASAQLTLSGSYDFYGHTGADGSLSQDVTLSTASVTTVEINSGDLLANISFSEQGLNPSRSGFLPIRMAGHCRGGSSGWSGATARARAGFVRAQVIVGNLVRRPCAETAGRPRQWDDLPQSGPSLPPDWFRFLENPTGLEFFPTRPA